LHFDQFLKRTIATIYVEDLQDFCALKGFMSGKELTA